MRVLAELGADAEAVRSAVNRHSVGARAGAPAAGALDEADLAALRSIGIDAEEVLRRMATDLGGLPPRSPDERARRLPMAADGKKVLELALREAISMKHGYIGTEHLLLGLLRGRAPIVAATADELGLTHDDVRAVVLATLRRTG
jgi:ATP-dependent Clp protease ATP-binding subunit ClpA